MDQNVRLAAVQRNRRAHPTMLLTSAPRWSRVSVPPEPPLSHTPVVTLHPYQPQGAPPHSPEGVHKPPADEPRLRVHRRPRARRQRLLWRRQHTQ
jgi:hypothetical protein